MSVWTNVTTTACDSWKHKSDTDVIIFIVDFYIYTLALLTLDRVKLTISGELQRQQATENHHTDLNAIVVSHG